MKNIYLHNLYSLSKELNLPIQWLKTKAIEGQIPCLRIGRKFRFNIEAVKAALVELVAKGEKNE